ncbi:MAG TPA: HK97 family phage prohead protease [Acidimicrobiales bacterium]
MDAPRRFYAVLRAETLTGRTFTGHAAVWDSLARIGGHWEQLARTAFDSALARPDDVALTMNHDPSRLLARSSSGTLRLAVDAVGLRVEADIADTTAGNDTITLLERGDLTGMSFLALMAPGTDTWSTAPDGHQLNTLTDFARLLDVSVVTFPAYADTDAVLRSVDFTTLPAVSGREQLVRSRAARLLKGNTK